MKKIASLLIIILSAASLVAQKNVIPVSQTRLLSLQLPEGSRQDKRFISVESASGLLTVSTGYKNIDFTTVEVYYLPPVAASGFNAGNVTESLTTNGFSLIPDHADKKLAWAIKDDEAYCIYYSADDSETNLYIGKGNINPLENNVAPPVTYISQEVAQPTAVTPAVNSQDFVPPLSGRRTGSNTVKTVVADDPNFVFDLDGNRYNVIKIGEQFWTRENLRTTQYNDTTMIAARKSGSEWSQLKYGAYAVYDDNPFNTGKYGLLYNGYAAASGKLCPVGWHVATDKDWIELEQFYGLPESELERTGERGDIAGKLKIPEDWVPSSFSGNNSSGFSIVPAGARLDNGEYSTLNQYGNFWTSTVYDDRYGLLYLWNHHVHYNTNAVGRIYTIATNGYSCRCVKDKPDPGKNK